MEEMKKLIVLVALLIVLPVSPVALAGIVDFDDGLSHTINDLTYHNDIVRVDSLVNNNPATHLELESGGSVLSLHAGHFATINMTGGTIAGNLEAWNLSTITMSGGSVGGDLYVNFKGFIYLNGTDFDVNGIPLGYGDRLSDVGIFTEDGDTDRYTGTITGTLSDGFSSLNNDFEISHYGFGIGIADIIIIPEPATIMFWGLGGIAMIILRA